MDAVALARQLDEEFRASCARLKSDEPWFGQFALRTRAKTTAYKVGAQRDPRDHIIDWRHPLARAYYEAKPGEEFEVDEEGFAHLSGVIEHLAAISARERTVRRVELRTREGTMTVEATESGFQLPSAGHRRLTHADGLPDVLALITPAQYRLITESRRSPVVIQGRAGSGKTTVALYRVAWLTYADEETREPPVDPSKVLIVMFNKALSTFVREGLKPLHLENARLDTFHAWALEEIRRSYRGSVEPDASAREGSTIASALKKQLGMLRALDAFVTAQSSALEAWLHEKLAPYEGAKWMARYRAVDLPVVRRLVSLRKEALHLRDTSKGAAQQRYEQVYAVFKRAIERMTLYKEELLKFLTDRELLKRHLPDASDADLAALAAFQTSLQADGGSDRRPGPKVAFDDFALLLRLIQLKNGGYPDQAREDEVRLYDHLVVDEAQDFGAVDLQVLLGSIRSRTGVTIVGDVNQKIVLEADFMGWDALVTELGVSGAKVARLEVAHRSTMPIMRVADTLVDDRTTSGRPGQKPALIVSSARESMLTRLVEIVRASYGENRSGHVCVVCRHARHAKSIHDELGLRLKDLGAPVRLGHNKQFEFSPGVTVTNVRQIKGLEFDTVVVLDPSEENYPVDDNGRRSLYTVITRAKERLVLLGVGEPTGLLQRAILEDLLELVNRPTVPPVTFSDADDDPF